MVQYQSYFKQNPKYFKKERIFDEKGNVVHMKYVYVSEDNREKSYERWIHRQSQTVDMKKITNEKDLKDKVSDFLHYEPTQKQMQIMKYIYGVTEVTEKRYEKNKVKENYKISYKLKSGESVIKEKTIFRDIKTGRFAKGE